MAEPTYDEVMTALRAADAAGNVEDARQLANIASRLSIKTAENPSASKFDKGQSEGPYQLNRFVGGAANLLSLPAEAVYQSAKLQNKVLGQIPILGNLYPNPDNFMRSPNEVIRGVMTDTTMRPPSRAAEIRGGISEFAGGGLAPSAAVIRSAAHKLPAIVGEIGSTVLGGAGSEVAGLPGAVAGSIIGFQTPALFSKAQAIVSGVVPWLRSKSQSAAPAELNAAIQANPQSSANIQQANDVSKRIADMGAGDFKPTLGATTGAPGIIAREQQIAGSSPEELSKYAARRSENEAAVSKATDTAFPQGGDIRRVAGDVRIGVTSELEKRLDKINESRDQLTQRLPDVPQQRVGETLDRLRDQAQGVARKVRDEKFDAVYAAADRAGVKENMNDIGALVRNIVNQDKNTFQSMPPSFSQIMREYPESVFAKEVSFQEVHSLYKRLNGEISAFTRSGDPTMVHHLMRVKNALNERISKYVTAPESVSPGLKDVALKLRDANKFFSEKYAPAFYEGVGGKMAASNRYGELVKPEDVVSKFFTPSGIDDFNLIYSTDKAAQTALADGITGLFRQSAVKNGKIDQRAAQSFIRTNEEALNKVPDIKAILQNPTAANEALLESASRIRQGISDFNKSAVSRIAKTDNPDALIDKALTDPRSLRQIVALGNAGGESAANAVTRSIADRIPIAAAKAKVDPFTFVTQNEGTLKPALDRLGKDHYENLKTIAGARAILDRTSVPTQVGATKLSDIVEQTTGSTPRIIWAQTVNTTAGRQSPVSAGLHLLSRFGIKVREDNAQKLMAEAIYNPEIAALWAKMAKGQTLSIPQSNALKNHFLSAGIRITEDQQGQ